MKIKNKLDLKKRRHLRIRKKITGSADVPRMCVSITNKHMYVQFVDDEAGTTLASVSNVGKSEKNNMAAAKSVGERASAVAREKGITRVRFDRGGHKYQGRVKAVAEATREAGITL